jgi:predicted transcriptional regulator|tara:strand:- start:370 stop:543 length:174 start_codon:yes stop_codon:yes gene_type:complete
MTIKEMKIIHVRKALLRYKTVKKVAVALGVTERTIWNYIKKEKDGKKALGNGLRDTL